MAAASFCGGAQQSRKRYSGQPDGGKWICWRGEQNAIVFCEPNGGFSSRRTPLKQSALDICFDFSQMFVRFFSRFAAAWRAHDETFLNQKWFIDFFDGFATFGYGCGQCG